MKEQLKQSGRERRIDQDISNSSTAPKLFARRRNLSYVWQLRVMAAGTDYGKALMTKYGDLGVHSKQSSLLIPLKGKAYALKREAGCGNAWMGGMDGMVATKPSKESEEWRKAQNELGWIKQHSYTRWTNGSYLWKCPGGSPTSILESETRSSGKE